MDDASRPSARENDASNVVHFPPRPVGPSTADDIADRLDAMQSGMTTLVDWLSTEAPRQRQQIAAMAEGLTAAIGLLGSAADREQELRDRLKEMAARVELLESPNRIVAGVAADAASGIPEALDELAEVVARQPTWWERNRGWAIPAMWVAGSMLLVALGVVTYRRMQQIERAQDRERKAIEDRCRVAEANYLALHAAYAEAQRALAAEQARPLKSFPRWEDHRHEHHHVHEHDERSFHSTAIANADEVAAAVREHLPTASAIAREVAVPPSTTIVQPTVHTRERVRTRERVTREKVRVVYVPKPEAAARPKRKRNAASIDAGAPVACERSRLLDEEIARTRRRLS